MRDMPPQPLRNSSYSTEGTPSMEQILLSIRHVISGIKDDVNDIEKSASEKIKEEETEDFSEESCEINSATIIEEPIITATHSPTSLTETATTKSFIPPSSAPSTPPRKTLKEEEILELTHIVDDQAYTNYRPNPSVITRSTNDMSANTHADSTNLYPINTDKPKNLSILEQIDKALGNINTYVRNASHKPLNPEPSATIDSNEMTETSSEEEVLTAVTDTHLACPTPPYQLHTRPSAKKNTTSDSLLSEPTQEYLSQSLKQLLYKLPNNLSKQEATSLRPGSRLEELMIDLLKPHLAEWINDHLPRIVERIIEKEIKQLVSNGHHE